MIEVTYPRAIANYEKLDAELKATSIGALVLYVGSKSINTVTVYVTRVLSASEDTVCGDTVNNFIDFTTAESLKIYLDEAVFPFVDDLIHRFAAENIATGITQAGKTGHVLGLFEKGYDVHSNGLPVSLKGAFDTGSLYEALAIISYLISNPTEYTGLDPFVSEAKLGAMAAEITAFLT